MTPSELTRRIKAEAARLGFDLVGVCRAVQPPHWNEFRRWLRAGYAGQMHYLVERAECYEHPQAVLPEARSLIVLGTNYRTAEPAEASSGYGRVSRYAWGYDYHEVIRRRMRQLIHFHRSLVPQARLRGVVDTAPLLERDFAQLAGLGWIGKNTLLIHPQLGSWLFLAVVLTSEELEYDSPFAKDLCGGCRACLDACPTGALVGARRLDARRCISYNTIELRGHIARELRSPQNSWVFGCDVCQEVCPWNRRTPKCNRAEFSPLPGTNPLLLSEVLSMTDEAFRGRFRHTPLWRSKRAGLVRNAAIVLGNQRAVQAAGALCRKLNDEAPEVRTAVAWALGQCRATRAGESLRRQLAAEPESSVREEITRALVAIGSQGEAPPDGRAR